MRTCFLAVTLVACGPADHDGDGFAADQDCDDERAAIYPGAAEVCDGLDNNCDGTVDEGVVVTWFWDRDGDGWGDDDAFGCEVPTEGVDAGGDCDDEDAGVFPGADEVCDGRDTDCDGEDDRERVCPEDCSNGYDDDHDGLVDCEDAACDGWIGCTELDCDDGLDDDDDGSIDCDDADCWGKATCASTLARVLGGTAAAYRRGADDGTWSFSLRAYDVFGSVRVDDGSSSWTTCTWGVDTAWFRSRLTDEGGIRESHNRLGVAVDPGCDVDLTFLPRWADPDRETWSWPGGGRWYDGHRFETWSDELDAAVVRHWYFDPLEPSDPTGGCRDGEPQVAYRDVDGDSFGATSRPWCAAVPAGWVTQGGDCDDDDGDVHPGAAEVCGDGLDNDCDHVSACPGLSGRREVSGAVAEVGGVADERATVVRTAGDVDGDGLEDWLIGAPQGDDPSANAGAAYLISGTASGSFTTAAADARIHGAASNDYLGSALWGVGDTNDDGYDDIVVGATGYDNAGFSRAGAAWLFTGPVTGDLTPADATASILGTGLQFLGAGVAPAGDLDDDGHADLLVGATADSTNGNVAGAVYVFLGPLAGDYTDADANAVLLGPGPDHKVGEVALGVGDVDGDGFADIAVGDRWSEVGGTDTGAVELVLGPAGAVVDLGDADAVWTGPEEARAGIEIAAGDIDGDGYRDIAVASVELEGMPPNVAVPHGEVYLVAGQVAPGDGELASQRARLIAERIWDIAGSCIAVGDIDGDGLDDLVVGAWGDDTNGLYAGALYVVRGPVAGVVDLADADGKIVGPGSLALLGDGCAILDHGGDVRVAVSGRDNGSGSDPGRNWLFDGGVGW